MLAGISSFFENYLKDRGEESGGEDKAHKIQLASAALMIELCKTDQDIDDSETNALVEILKSRFDLSAERLEELMRLAEQEVKDAVSLYQFTSLLNEEFNYEDKTLLIRNLWEVAFADGNLDRYEEHLIRKVAELMYVSHSDFIRTKLAVKEEMGL